MVIKMDYKDYWKGERRQRKKTGYYTKRYDRLKSFFKFTKTDRIIDIGGGDGQFMEYLDITNATILDISDSGLEFARQRGFTAIKGDIQSRFDITQKKFNNALCCEVLEHLDYPCKTLSEINNILVDSGVLYIAQPNIKPNGTHHVRRFKLNELKEDLTKTGFTIESVAFVPAFFLDFLNPKVADLFARFFPNRFALFFVIKARKINGGRT